MKGYFKTLKKCLKNTKECTGWLFAALIFTIFSTVLELLVPVYLGKCLDLIVGVGNVDFNNLIKTILLLIVLVAVCALFTWLSNYLTNVYSIKTTQVIRKKFFEKIQTVPIRYVDSKTHGDLLSRMVNDTENVTDGFLEGVSTIFNGVITIISTLIFMFVLNVSIALIITILTPFSLFISFIIAKKSQRLFRAHAKSHGDMTGFLEEMVTSQSVVKMFNHEDENINAFKKLNSHNYTVGEKSDFYASITNPLTRFVNAFVYIAVAFIGAILALNGHITIGTISVFLSYANSFGKPFSELSSEITELQTAFASAERIFNVLDEKDEPSDLEFGELGFVDGSLRVENASFSYVPKQKLLQNLNLDIKPGQKIAIVGPTGCGKTTFINLLMRFYDLTGGTIYLSGTDISKVKRSSLRSQYGMVLQESWMFNATVKENIAYGKPTATLEEVIQASKMAGAHEFVSKLEKGYDTIISEGGSNISQGQKQLICIARIMLLNPPMLILDEATSNIDTRMEMKIQSAFDVMMQGRTSFIVAHRLSTIKNADLILVMNKGNIIEQGTHNELMKKDGFYCKLYNSQFANANDE